MIDYIFSYMFLIPRINGYSQIKPVVRRLFRGVNSGSIVNLNTAFYGIRSLPVFECLERNRKRRIKGA